MSASKQLLTTEPYGRLQAQGMSTARLAQRLSVTSGFQGAGSITGTHIAAGSITTLALAAGSITATLIAAGTINAGHIAAGTITGDRIAANTLTAGNIAAGTITATQIAANTITASHIAGVSITADRLVANSITAGQIAAGTITATELAASSVTATQIAANSITASHIQGASITADRLAANTITAGQIAAATITGDRLTAGTITGDRIAANTVTADLIAAGTITGTEIAAATITGSLVEAGTLTATHVATGTLTGSLLAAGTVTGDRIAADTITATNLDVSTLSAITADLGTVTAGKMQIGTDGGIKVAMGQAISTSIGPINGVVTTDATNAITFLLHAATGNVYMKGAIQPGSTGLGNLSGQINGSTNIAPATIIGDRLAVGTITATQIAAATITGTEIAAATITGGKLVAGTITATQIAAGTITADRLNVTSLSAITANLGTITGGTITGGTIRTAATGARVVLDSTGLKQYDTSSNMTIDIPSDGSDAEFRGHVSAVGLELPMGTSVGTDNMLAWREAGGGVGASAYGAYIAGDFVFMMNHITDPAGDGGQEAYLYQSIEHGAGEAAILAGASYIAGQDKQVRVIDSDGFSDFQQMRSPTVRVYKNPTAQSIGASVITKITFDTAAIDAHYTDEGAPGTPHFDNASDRLFARKEGIYLVQGSIVYAANGTGDRYAGIRLSGVDIVGGQTSQRACAGLQTIVSVSALVSMTAGSYVELFGWQSSGAALNVEASTAFQMARLARIL